MGKYEFLRWLHDACQLAKSGAFAKYCADAGAPNQVATIGQALKSIAGQVPDPQKIERIRSADEVKAAERQLLNRLEVQGRQRDERERMRQRVQMEAEHRRRVAAQIDAKVAALEAEKLRIMGGAA